MREMQTPEQPSLGLSLGKRNHHTQLRCRPLSDRTKSFKIRQPGTPLLRMRGAERNGRRGVGGENRIGGRIGDNVRGQE